ncbi:MAG: PRC-barrel domain-containing protein, partial [Candidatus Pacearchaeota archaeon]
KKLGVLRDFIFDIKSGEVIHMVLTNVTSHAKDLNLEQTKNNEVLVPWNSLLSIEDVIVVNDEDLI